jgi:hypothetical protein
MNEFRGGAEARRVTKCRSVLSINWYVMTHSHASLDTMIVLRTILSRLTAWNVKLGVNAFGRKMPVSCTH